MNGLNETVVIWSAECRRTLRSSRVVALLGLYSLFSLVVFLAAIFLRSIVQQMVEAGMMPPSEELPLSVRGVYYLSLFFLPLYIALMGFDQVSGEVGPRSIRYLTVRSRRSSIVLGKLLAQTTVLWALVFALDFGLCVYTAFTTPGFGAGAFARYLVHFWVASALYSFAFLSLTALCSCLTTSPAVSLILNLAVLLSSLILWMTALADEGNPVRNARYLSPLRYSLGLLSPETAQVALSAAAYAVFSVLFLGGALAALRTRDL
ncbi:ABC transporter permease [Melittangium boletus]|uniref:ABC transporter permease n=1 Tax=Melittangium boletus TaxID=83453 RepID=UPI003DA2D78E